MKRYFRTMTAIAAAAMAIAQAAPASAAYYWRQDARGWWLADENGAYLTNQWYQSPASGLWYYMGADGYMLVNTVTPDGYTVDADGVWRGASGGGAGAQQAASSKDGTAIQPIVEAYKAYDQKRNAYPFIPDSYVFVDIDSDGMPECVATNGKSVQILTYGSGTVTSSRRWTINDYSDSDELLYLPNGNVLCIYEYTSVACTETRTFYQIENDGSFKEIGSSYHDGNSWYKTPSRNDATKEIYDDYNNSFGSLTEISIEYDDTYRSIDDAFAGYLRQ